MRHINLFLKRVMDILGSLIGIIILSPLLIIISILIKIDSKGPILFKQERLGKHGKVFKIFKFRTMVVNAENIGDGLTVKKDGDPRIIGIGKILRKYSLDELPQLFNVFIGNMALVGPRPPVTYFPYKGYNKYPIWAKTRFAMKPGITGLTQTTVRNSVDWDERIRIDNVYVNKFNIFLDIKLIFKTLFKVIKPSSIYGESQRK
ncbi:sugar transferase [Mycoplasmatota bacterium]|nr:sugar transferase [Mycoplasmatota bacterium]